MLDLSFYKNKKVLITGHTGFKGTWMCHVLKHFGADVVGYSLNPPTSPSLYEVSGIENDIKSYIADIRDLDRLKEVFEIENPEIVIHMAAQPIVRESYLNPVYTYETNVMGTVNIMEAIRLQPSVKSVVNVTTDKVYLNREWQWGYRENEELNGFDPYSNSKSCSELVTSSYKNSFFADRNIAISTCRAGNVIGGGDFAKDRIIPDCIRAAIEGDDIVVRNPYSTRPYQHVLEPVVTYLMIAAKQYENMELASSYNVGPDDCDCYSTGKLVSEFCSKWETLAGKRIKWIDRHDGGPHEANFLKLDCSKLKNIFGWSPRWRVSEAINKIIEWTLAYENGEDISGIMKNQIHEFIFE